MWILTTIVNSNKTKPAYVTTLTLIKMTQQKVINFGLDLQGGFDPWKVRLDKQWVFGWAGKLKVSWVW